MSPQVGLAVPVGLEKKAREGVCVWVSLEGVSRDMRHDSRMNTCEVRHVRHVRCVPLKRSRHFDRRRPPPETPPPSLGGFPIYYDP